MGQAVFHWGIQPWGSYRLYAHYLGDPLNAPSLSAPVTFFIDFAPMSVMVPPLAGGAHYTIPSPVVVTATRMPGSSEGSTTHVVRVYEQSTGNLRSESRDGVTASWTPTLQGDIASKTDARGKTIHYLHYHRGVPQREEQPENVVVARQVSPDGNVLAETDGELKTVRYDYDGLNRIITIDHPLGNDVIVTWGTNTRTVTRGSYVEETHYDGYGRVDRVTHRDTARGEAIMQTYAYDAYGRQTFASYPNDTTGARTGYDVLGRPTRVEHATTLAGAPTAFMTHTYLGHVVRQINERDFAYHYTYRGYGNPDAQELMAIAAPEPAANVTITRNVRGQPVTVAQGATGDPRTRQYCYDAHYFLERQTDPEVGDTIYGRDAVGNMTSRRVGTSQTTIFDYDDRNRLTAMRYPDSGSTGVAPAPHVIRTYYHDDKPKTIENTPSAIRSYVYDANKNLTSETLELAGQKFTMKYGYDDNDALASLTYGSGAQVDYAPDAFGRPTRATPYVTAIAHHPHGAVKKLVYTNGTVHEVTLHPRLWPETVAATSPVTLLSRLGCQYDQLGNVKTITDPVVAGNNWSLEYDPIDRVVTASGSGVTALYNIAYDGRGNLKRKAIGFSIYDYTYHLTSERLTRVQGTRTNIAFTPPLTTTFDYNLAYDLYGNIINREGITFQYNDAGHLVCARCFTTSERRYTYDGAGIRVSDRQGSNTTFYMHGNAGTLLWEVGPNGEV